MVGSEVAIVEVPHSRSIVEVSDSALVCKDDLHQREFSRDTTKLKCEQVITLRSFLFWISFLLSTFTGVAKLSKSIWRRKRD